MSTRSVWAIFTLTVIIVVEFIVAQSALEWMLIEEITVRNIPLVTIDTNKPADKLIAREDLKDKHFQQLFPILYKADAPRALQVTGALLLFGALAGFLIASVGFRHLVSFGDRMNKLSVMDKVAIFLGGILGIFLSLMFLPPFFILVGNKPNPVLPVVLGTLVTYLCVWFTLSIKEQLKFYFPNLTRPQDFEKVFQQPKILDTNVIIDGRVSDICNAGFIEGKVFVPSFVLDELQHIADSGDSLRRARGRRGLDILNQMRKELGLEVKQCDPVNAENPEEVDVRLVKLAKEIDGAIVTNDFNLNKVAELQGVLVLNINQLANALKPVVLPGEELTVNVIKEGKELNQGIAYLDDGTMIVIEGAKMHIGETVEVLVASVLQTVAGKMIFANLKSMQEEQDALIDRNVRNYSGFRPRRKAY